MPMNPKPEIRRRYSGLALVWVVQVLLFIASVVFTQAFREEESLAGTMLLAARLGALAATVACVYFPSVTIALCVVTTVAIFEPCLPVGDLYSEAFFLLGSGILWFRAGRPRLGLTSVLFLMVAACFAYNFARDAHAENNIILSKLCLFYVCAGVFSCIGTSNVGRSIKWPLVAMSAGVAASLSVIASIVWCYVYSDLSVLGLAGSGRLGAMSLESGNSAAAGWATGVLAWGVYAACGGRWWKAIVGGVVCLVGVILTRAMGASIVLMLCLPFVLQRRLGTARLFWCIAIGAIALISAFTVVERGVSSMFSVEDKDLKTLSSRTLVWKMTVDAVIAQPTGHTMSEWRRKGLEENQGNRTVALTPHNAVLQAAAYGGGVGFISCLSVMLLVVYKPLSRLRYYRSWSLLSVFTSLSLLTVDVWYFYPMLMLSMYNAPQADIVYYQRTT